MHFPLLKTSSGAPAGCPTHSPVHLLVGLVALVEGIPVDDVPVAVGQHAPEIVGTFTWEKEAEISRGNSPLLDIQ